MNFLYNSRLHYMGPRNLFGCIRDVFYRGSPKKHLFRDKEIFAICNLNHTCFVYVVSPHCHPGAELTTRTKNRSGTISEEKAHGFPALFAFPDRFSDNLRISWISALPFVAKGRVPPPIYCPLKGAISPPPTHHIGCTQIEPHLHLFCVVFPPYAPRPPPPGTRQSSDCDGRIFFRQFPPSQSAPVRDQLPHSLTPSPAYSQPPPLRRWLPMRRDSHPPRRPIAKKGCSACFEPHRKKRRNKMSAQITEYAVDYGKEKTNASAYFIE